ncbi:hypothetical protein [Marichromatium bheemlicum]|uniref:Uncharacterized protein n=1 Tax=Marichromatium bheemlicum TaxID=365339 RepID=A0ABX1IBW8_9GAMM|nr:hypothetical protein [Marichromatium bheemlicum]NKN33865.1 hypothetical protein [Marichromatium bheemlicum]
MTRMRGGARWQGLMVALALLCSGQTLATGLDLARGDLDWGDARPVGLEVLHEEQFRGRAFTICADPGVAPVLGEVDFDQRLYRFVDGRLTAISFIKEDAGLDWYRASRDQLEAVLGAPAQVLDNPMLELYQTYWRDAHSMGSLEWDEGDVDYDESPSVSFTLSPPLAL